MACLVSGSEFSRFTIVFSHGNIYLAASFSAGMLCFWSCITLVTYHHL